MSCSCRCMVHIVPGAILLLFFHQAGCAWPSLSYTAIYEGLQKLSDSHESNMSPEPLFFPRCCLLIFALLVCCLYMMKSVKTEKNFMKITPIRIYNLHKIYMVATIYAVCYGKQNVRIYGSISNFSSRVTIFSPP